MHCVDFTARQNFCHQAIGKSVDAHELQPSNMLAVSPVMVVSSAMPKPPVRLLSIWADCCGSKPSMRPSSRASTEKPITLPSKPSLSWMPLSHHAISCGPWTLLLKICCNTDLSVALFVRACK